MPPIIECVPNFSEGRRQDIIDAIVSAITTVSGVRVLHQTSDVDHNRTVVTFAGEPTAVVDAAFEGIRIANQLIDMTQHEGVHPRIGAADVIPFVPIEDTSMQDCIKLANILATRVASDLGIPVYLYAEAAKRPHRRSLAAIRRGEYEALRDLIKLPERHPDYGAPVLGTGGAVAIGARKPLIAYNVFLNTDDVMIAKKIARAIRESSGGLRGVRALGLLVKGRAQVSMNLVDYEHTPIYRVMELIRIEANRLGASIYESELIGLMPQDALIQSAAWYLQLPILTTSDLLEYQLNHSE